MLNVPPSEFVEFVTGDNLVNGTVPSIVLLQRKPGFEPPG